MRVLGIDPSTRTGLAFLDNGTASFSVLNFPDARGLVRLQSIARGIDSYLEAHPSIDVAVVEGYAFANAHTLVILVEIGVLFRLALYNLGVPCYIVPPTLLKKWVSGNGRAKKPEMAGAVQKKWGFEAPSNDVVDAYGLARMAEYLSHGHKIPGAELVL